MTHPFRSFGANLDTGDLAIEMADGSIANEHVAITREALGINVRSFRIDFTRGELTLGLPNGRDALAALEWLGRSDARALGHRQVLYLDQRDWSKLSAARHGTAPLDDAERAAAEEIAALVCAGEVVLPISSAHVIETDALRGEKREALASTMLELSRGWQMRHPLNISRDELAAALELGTPPNRAGVFTLAPNAMFVYGRRLRTSPLPAPFDRIMPVVSAVTGTYDVLVDGAPLTDDAGRRRALAGWVASQEGVATLLASRQAPAAEVRRAALGRLLVDSAEHLARSSRGRFDMDAFRVWAPGAGGDVAAMPYLARSWQLHYARLRNGAPWAVNDLLDIHNLCAASGYAHIVVGEKRTIGDLRTAKHVPDGAVPVTSLVEAVAALSTARLLDGA
jgi:hypothetical protein